MKLDVVFGQNVVTPWLANGGTSSILRNLVSWRFASI